MIRYCLLLFPLLLAACGSHTGKRTDGPGHNTAGESAEAPTSDFYKRYSGTIAGKPVTVHLQRYAGNVQGTYYYAAGQAIALRSWDDSLKADDRFYLSELVPDGSGDDATWSLRIVGSHATGEWRNADSTKRYPINLAEEYPEGSVRLSAHRIADSSALVPDNPSSPKAMASYSYLLPEGGADGFLYNTLRAQTAPLAGGDEDIESRLQAAMAAYFANYRKENESSIKELDISEAAFAFSYTNDEAMYIRYNDRGWLVTESFVASYTGGAHGNYGSSFANIDLAGQRIWKIDDIITDTAQLRPLLNDAAILYFKLKPGEGMDERMLVDEVPPTSNMCIGPAGVSFVYNPYEIASYADGQVTLYLSYRKLMPYLTPAFKQRMALTERAGIATQARPGYKKKQRARLGIITNRRFAPGGQAPQSRF